MRNRGRSRRQRRQHRLDLGQRAWTLRFAYGTSKAGLTHLTKQQAVELASLGIRVDGVAPGPVDTAMAKQVHTAEIRADYHDAIPLNRYGLEDEIAEAIWFLCADAASYVTGQILAVDGGFEATGWHEVTGRRGNRRRQGIAERAGQSCRRSAARNCQHEGRVCRSGVAWPARPAPLLPIRFAAWPIRPCHRSVSMQPQTRSIFLFVIALLPPPHAAMARRTTPPEPTATTTTLVSSLDPAPAGANVTLTATVAGASPTGSVHLHRWQRGDRRLLRDCTERQTQCQDRRLQYEHPGGGNPQHRGAL